MKPQMWKKSGEPIISSLLETDVYKILMLNYIYRHYTNLNATFAFKNRTNVNVRAYIDFAELKEQLAHVASLRFSEGEIAHLSSWQMFQSEFGTNLRNLRLEVPEMTTLNKKLAIWAGGLWSQSTLWEIPVLSIVSELYVRGRAKAEGYTEADLLKEGTRRLDEKIAFFNAHPNLKFSQFGLRRRAGSEWEKYVTYSLMTKTKSMTGVSNVWLARELGAEAQGTRAHELDMAAYAFARGKSNFDARASIYKTLTDWQSLYGQKALIMLPDAYGTDAFLEKLPDGFAQDWRGFRQDSGDPIAFGEKIIAFCKKNGIDPTKKLVIWSDGLTKETMLKIYGHFKGRVIVAFGVGTDLTNDMGLVSPLSLVMKLFEVNGLPTVKLSDNIAKATGDEKEIEAAKRIFGYDNTFNEAVRV